MLAAVLWRELNYVAVCAAFGVLAVCWFSMFFFFFSYVMGVLIAIFVGLFFKIVVLIAVVI